MSAGYCLPLSAQHVALPRWLSLRLRMDVLTVCVEGGGWGGLYRPVAVHHQQRWRRRRTLQKPRHSGAKTGLKGLEK